MNRVLGTDLQHVADVPLPVMHERLRAARRYTVVKEPTFRAYRDPADCDAT